MKCVASGIVALLVVGDVMAQCGAGIPSAGNPGCIPPNQQNSPYYQGSTAPAQTAETTARWSDRWAAVALDLSSGDAGFSTDKASKGAAASSALNDCQSGGAQNCEVFMTYYNQCAALSQEKGGGHVFGASSPKRAIAKQQSLDNCTKAGKSCDVVYSNCVTAQRID